jgi:hypothetical protein
LAFTTGWAADFVAGLVAADLVAGFAVGWAVACVAGLATNGLARWAFLAALAGAGVALGVAGCVLVGALVAAVTGAFWAAEVVVAWGLVVMFMANASLGN